ncbi:MAG TPA: NAD(P)-binding domain-containing protein [Pantanalinema sp.]
MKRPIGFVGVGRMGANMARRLKDCGYAIAALHDVNREAARSLATELDARACETLAEVTASAEIVFTVISDDAGMREIFLRPGDNLLAGAKGKLFINCATLTPGLHRAIEQHAHAAGAETLEACMASSIPQARGSSASTAATSRRPTPPRTPASRPPSAGRRGSFCPWPRRP